MKAHVAGILSLVVAAVVTVRAQSNAANSHANLAIVLEGPFAVCENTTDKTLTINVPVLDGTHYVPGFIGAWDELPLGNTNNKKKFLKGPDQADYQMDNAWGSGKSAGTMTVVTVSQSNNPLVFLYSERGDCSLRKNERKSISLTVPDPDKIFPLERAGALSDVKDNTGKSVGPCAKYQCRYATKVVLLYEDVNYSNGAPCIMKLSNNHASTKAFCIDQQSLIGGNYEIELETQPISGRYQLLSTSVKHSQQAFSLAGELMGKQRTINYDVRKLGEVGYAPTHSDCHTPLIFVCTTGSACNQSQ